MMTDLHIAFTYSKLEEKYLFNVLKYVYFEPLNEVRIS